MRREAVRIAARRPAKLCAGRRGSCMSGDLTVVQLSTAEEYEAASRQQLLPLQQASALAGMHQHALVRLAAEQQDCHLQEEETNFTCARR